MTMLDSDSEDEDNRSNLNLNCAILNDSFVMSPQHELTGSTTSEQFRTAAPLRANDSNLSFLGRFGNMGINCSSNNNTSTLEQQQQVAPPTKKAPPSTLQMIAEQRSAVDNQTPMRAAPAAGTTAAKSHAKLETEFVTPQVRSIGIKHGARTHTSQKTRSEVDNEFRSQKVLFQTPMTVSRGAPFNSDSLTFSLCDTISESPDTPAQPPQLKEKPSGGKSKKSLEGAFTQAEQAKPAVPELAVSVPSKPVSVHKKPDTVAPTAKSNSNLLKIKNHEYVMVKKLGCGGSSSVYLARRKDTVQEYALKVVDLQGDPLVVQGYLNETKLLEKLQGNVCVVSLFD